MSTSGSTLLADRLVVKDHATDAFTETGRRHNQLSICVSGSRRLRDVQLRETFVAGGIAFIHRQQPFVIGDQCLRSVR
jgi:hypothetical protein